MARMATTSDAFNAVAEPRRRAIIEILATGKGKLVGELACELGIAQPAISKHLGVLRQVGLVDVERNGQKRIYSLRGENLKSVHEWVSQFERFWDEHLKKIKEHAERTSQEHVKDKNP